MRISDFVFNKRLEKGQNVEENRNNLIKAAQKFINEIVISTERYLMFSALKLMNIQFCCFLV